MRCGCGAVCGVGSAGRAVEMLADAGTTWGTTGTTAIFGELLPIHI